MPEKPIRSYGPHALLPKHGEQVVVVVQRQHGGLAEAVDRTVRAKRRIGGGGQVGVTVHAHPADLGRGIGTGQPRPRVVGDGRTGRPGRSRVRGLQQRRAPALLDGALPPDRPQQPAVGQLDQLAVDGWTVEVDVDGITAAPGLPPVSGAQQMKRDDPTGDPLPPAPSHAVIWQEHRVIAQGGNGHRVEYRVEPIAGGRHDLWWGPGPALVARSHQPDGAAGPAVGHRGERREQRSARPGEAGEHRRDGVDDDARVGDLQAAHAVAWGWIGLMRRADGCVVVIPNLQRFM